MRVNDQPVAIARFEHRYYYRSTQTVVSLIHTSDDSDKPRTAIRTTTASEDGIFERRRSLRSELPAMDGDELFQHRVTATGGSKDVFIDLKRNSQGVYLKIKEKRRGSGLQDVVMLPANDPEELHELRGRVDGDDHWIVEEEAKGRGARECSGTLPFVESRRH